MAKAGGAIQEAHVVVLGGGNGTSRLLSALLPLIQDKKIASLHALVHMSDDGGSTGRLREQYDVAAMGDLTKCLMALSILHGDVRGEEVLRAFEYRFANGDFQGHTLRNIFLTALEKTNHDIDAAIAVMARVLQVPKYAGVIPTTLRTITERVSVADKVLGEGEHSIAHTVDMQADPTWKPGDVKVSFVEGDVSLNPRAAEILREATHIIVAPGHTYGTILPTLALPALQDIIKESSAKLFVVMTLLTTPRQTNGWNGEDFVQVYESYLGRPADVVVANTASLPSVSLVDGQNWIAFTANTHAYELIAADIVSMTQQPKQEGDTVPRAVVVHDAIKLRDILTSLLR